MRQAYRPEAPEACFFRTAERSRARSRAKLWKAPAGPWGGGPVRDIKVKLRATRSPATSTIFNVRNSSSFEIAQRETKPTPSPASTADLIASVESRFSTLVKAFNLIPALLRAVST